MKRWIHNAIAKQAKESPFSAQQWLDELHCDGLTLSLDELLRYQKLASKISLKPSRSVKGQLAGNYLSVSKGRGMEFDEVRHYQAGDDIRTIDWRVTARTGKPHTKLFREEKERPVFILVDFSPSMFFGSQLLFKSVQAAHLAAVIAWVAKERGDKIGGLIASSRQHRELKPKSRQQGVLQLFHQLISVHNAELSTTAEASEQSDNLQFESACARLRRLAMPGSLVFIISDFEQLTDASIKHLSQLKQHCEIHARQIIDPLETALPTVKETRHLPVTDGKTNKLLMLGDKQFSLQYEQMAHARQIAIDTQLKKLGIPTQRISAGKPIFQQFD